jgi:hypothetical protein
LSLSKYRLKHAKNWRAHHKRESARCNRSFHARLRPPPANDKCGVNRIAEAMLMRGRLSNEFRLYPDSTPCEVRFSSIELLEPAS